jgi:hypothetical protein
MNILKPTLCQKHSHVWISGSNEPPPDMKCDCEEYTWEAMKALSVQADDCPSCAGSGKKEIGGMLLMCLACNGTGNRR